jgi:hypothetical protein
MMRGVTDFTNAAQFNAYLKGYQHLVVISVPEYLKVLGSNGNADAQKLLDLFCYILEYEFKGLDGIEDITVDNIEFTDGISTMNSMGKVTQQSASEISMSFTEKSGSVITKFIDMYIRGVRDPRTQAKTYHGLIKNGILAAGFENEVFNLMYIVTDETMLGLEKAYLLCNAWPNKVPSSIYNGTKGEIEKVDIEVTMQCFVIDGEEVDARALKMLAYLNEADAVKNMMAVNDGFSQNARDTVNGFNNHSQNQIELDSGKFKYSVFDTVNSNFGIDVASTTSSGSNNNNANGG